ncbi:MAG: nuclear transport factor 2 family protein [Proteobacteria bacterium]|nr:nuclear transport factor 2 family protein [Pseudomonadota bacterium]
MEKLLAARARWMRAYFDGDVDTLDKLEADDFSSTCRLGNQNKKEQLAGIASAVREGCWFADGSMGQDLQRHVHMLGDLALVHGVIRTEAFGQLPPSVASTEVWQRAGSDWQALRLHFSDLKQR